MRFVLKLVLGVMALVFAMSLLLAAAVVVVFTVVTALLTGKKPAPAMVFSRFRQYSPQDVWRRRPPPTESPSQVVDVEMRDVTCSSDAGDVAPLSAPGASKRADDVSDVLPKKPVQPSD